MIGGAYSVLRTGVELYARRSGASAEYQPMDRPPGFRKLATGSSTSATYDPFVGLDTDAPTLPAYDVAQVEGRVCDALYGGPPAPGIVPIASFSDYYCPFCRVLTRRLAEYDAETPGVRLHWHELPILGDGSLAAARAALAADRQGAYVAFHDRLMGSPFQPTEAYLHGISADLGLDAARLLAEMDGPQVTADIADSLALTRLFATIGTPLVVIGRTVIQGTPDMDLVARIVAEERAEGLAAICA